MSLSDLSRNLLDVNILVALADKNHFHHELVRAWFYQSPRLSWALCAFAEAGFLRYTTAPRPEQLTVTEARDILQHFAQHPGYSYLPVDADWQTLSSPFSRRLHGTKQITDAYLLGLAIRHGLVLVTMDKGIVHLAGNDFSRNVLLLQ